MLRLLVANLAYRLRDWLRKPAKQDVVGWSLTPGYRVKELPRRPIW